MKVYLFYLTLPDQDKMKDYFSEELIENFREVQSSLNQLTKRYSYETGNTMYLYAITDKKEYADIFESLHDMNIFKKFVKKLDKDEYEDLRKENLLAILDWRFTDNEKSFDDETNEKILCPKSEYLEITDTLSIHLDQMLFEATIEEYSIFKDDYVAALDYLLYCTYNKINSEDSEYYSYNYSYGITPEEYAYRVNLKPNYINLYTKLYGLLLRKENCSYENCI